METRTIFLASSSELVEDRREFEIQINRQNKEWIKKGLFLDLVVWEDFLDALSQTRLQEEYNQAIRNCDIFVMLFWTKVGRYTEEEFDTAVGQFKATQRPFIYTYFKSEAPAVSSAQDERGLKAFKDKLSALGHYYTRYANTAALTLHFRQQLDKLAAAGFLQRDRPVREDDADSSMTEATLHGSGAIAQGSGAVAVGAGGVYVGGRNSGTINTGTQTVNTGGGAYVGGRVETSGGDFIGRDRISVSPASEELERLFGPVVAEIERDGRPDVRASALGRARELQAEVSKGKDADDKKVGRLIDGLIDLVPKAVGAVTSMFATPVLAGIIGPVTSFVLDKLKGRH